MKHSSDFSHKEKKTPVEKRPVYPFPDVVSRGGGFLLRVDNVCDNKGNVQGLE